MSGGKISLALGGAKKGKLAAKEGVKRSRAALDDGEDDGQQEGKAQAVSHFDRSAGGAIDETNRPQKEQPLFIAPQANRDWREGSRRNKRQKVPNVVQQNGQAEEVEAREASNKPGFGLTVAQKPENGSEPAEDGEAMDVNGHEQGEDEAPAKPKTDDELAMDALLGKKTESTLVVPAMTEEEAFNADIASAPAMATLEEYARVPVEQFGAAMLRGMGWKEGEGIGSQRGKKVKAFKAPERRPALLGIGAKEEAAVKDEMGAWGRGAKGKDAKVYNPVLLRDRRTGEMFTEEEAEGRKKEEERKKYEVEFEEKEARKEERRRRDGDERDGTREKERSKKERPHRRDDSRRRDDDSDEEYYRRKEAKRKRREREEDEDEERRRRKEKEKRRRDGSRERERRHHRSRSKERHRDGERDRRRRDRD